MILLRPKVYKIIPLIDKLIPTANNMTNLITTILLIMILQPPSLVLLAPFPDPIQKHLKIILSSSEFKEATQYVNKKIPKIKNQLKMHLKLSIHKLTNNVGANQLVDGLTTEDVKDIQETDYESDSSEYDSDSFTRDNGYIGYGNPAMIMRSALISL